MISADKKWVAVLNGATVWVAVLNGAIVVALQHSCGVQDAPVNCYIDERNNWTCPNCLTTYGAPAPIDSAWRQSVATTFEEESL